jgi:hypothetical protein
MRLQELKGTYAVIKRKVEEKKIPTAIITLADFLANQQRAKCKMKQQGIIRRKG